jgi:DnaJ-class molecular chaperone
MNEPIEHCEFCRGSGRIRPELGKPEKECPVCNGTGRAPPRDSGRPARLLDQTPRKSPPHR